jgi:branched-chain amino acid transport system ATP-binding protein
VGLKDRAHARANTLPHGDKRKLELEILLAQDPEILLLDEPTAGMASEQVPQLMSLIADIRRRGNKTILLVEHNMDIVMNVSDAITVMHQGQVLAEGTPAQISANEQVQKAYLGELYNQ